MKIVKVSPENIQAKINEAEPGTVIKLQKGVYRDPITIRGLNGNAANPIIIQGGPQVIFDGGVSFEEFQPTAIEWTWRNTENGRYPGLYDDASCAFIRLFECSHVVIEGILFRGFWPTIIYFFDSTDLHFNDLNMLEGTFAIYGEGDGSKKILVENCNWLQDISERKLWFELGWTGLHDVIKTENSARAFDGAFFRTRNIKGEVVIRNNTVLHAANGVHMFNRKPGENRLGLNNNVQIYNNCFSYIRDNAIEPERKAINWWVFGNQLENCHKPFSLGLDTAGYFYIFGNSIWSNSKPGVGESHTGGAIFKIDKKYKNIVGPFYIFNNSFYSKSCYMKKGQIPSLCHWNNAIVYCDVEVESNSDFCSKKSFFKGFSSEWNKWKIEFDNDLYIHHDFPSSPKYEIYNITNFLVEDPLFLNPKEGCMEIGVNSPALNSGRAVKLKMPNGKFWDAPVPVSIGSWQRNFNIDGPKFEFFDE